MTPGPRLIRPLHEDLEDRMKLNLEMFCDSLKIKNKNIMSKKQREKLEFKFKFVASNVQLSRPKEKKRCPCL